MVLTNSALQPALRFARTYPTRVNRATSCPKPSRRISVSSVDSNETADAVKQTIIAALDSGAAYVTLTDSKGATYVIPTAGIAFVEVGTDQSRRVGFVA